MATGFERGEGQGGGDHRQAASRADGHGAAGLPGGVHALHGSGGGSLPAGALRVAAEPRASSRLPRLVVDLAAIQENWRLLASLAPESRTGAAVKADAYGHGAARVGPALAEAGCRDFFVAWGEEGAVLRQALRARVPDVEPQCTIFVLQGFDPAALPDFAAHALTPVLSTAEDVAHLLDAPREARLPAAIQLETGMNRLGLDPPAAERAAEGVASGEIEARLAMSHLAAADLPEDGQNDDQLARFREAARLFRTVPLSLANSAGVFLGPAFAFDLTRPGIALYGGACGPRAAGLLRPAATLLATILQVRDAPAGALVGYGGACRLARPSRIATVGIGYADGYLRAASGHGVPLRDDPTRPQPEAAVSGHRAPILGRVSMDLTLLDVTDVPEALAHPGAEVEMFGPTVPVDQIAAAAGTIGYEMLAGLGVRTNR